MPIVRRLARPLLAASFISAGVDAALHPRSRAEGMRPVVQRLAPALRLPQDPELFVRANGAAMAGAGGLLALGRLPRLSALALVATLLPATYSEHAFWQEKDPQARRASRKLFLRDAGLLGGALLAMVDTEGRPGALWLGRHAVRQTEKAGRTAGRRAGRHVGKARRRVEKAGREAISH
jgi:putative oxidoreductase